MVLNCSDSVPEAVDEALFNVGPVRVHGEPDIRLTAALPELGVNEFEMINLLVDELEQG